MRFRADGGVENEHNKASGAAVVTPARWSGCRL